MKILTNAIIALVASPFLASMCMAGDVEDIIEITNEHFATQNAGDAKAHVAGHMPTISFFLANGGFLNVETSHEEQVKNMQALYDAGIKFDLKLVNPTVNVYDGKFAVLTGYMVGATILPGGKRQQSMSRRTAVLIKDGNTWKEVHAHTSPIVAPTQ